MLLFFFGNEFFEIVLIFLFCSLPFHFNLFRVLRIRYKNTMGHGVKKATKSIELTRVGNYF